MVRLMTVVYLKISQQVMTVYLFTQSFILVSTGIVVGCRRAEILLFLLFLDLRL